MREDRHGRVARSDNDRRRRPAEGFRAGGAARFRRLAEDAILSLPQPVLDALDGAETVVEAIPPPQDTDAEVPLAAFTPAGPGRPATLTLYRRAIESRATGKPDLTDLIRLAAGREVVLTLGLDVDLEDDWDE